MEAMYLSPLAVRIFTIFQSLNRHELSGHAKLHRFSAGRSEYLITSKPPCSVGTCPVIRGQQKKDLMSEIFSDSLWIGDLSRNV